MEGPKRPLPDDSPQESSVVLKKQKTDSALSTAQQQPGVSCNKRPDLLSAHVTSSFAYQQPCTLTKAPRRTSGLLAPIMLLNGHAGEVFGVKFSPDGSVLASCSHDKNLHLWRVYGECENFMIMKGVP